MLTRSYFLKVPPEINAGKRTILRDLQNEWQRTLGSAFTWYWAPFWKTGRFDFALKTSGPNASFPITRLGVAHKDQMVQALAGQARSWTGNLVNRGRRVIGQTTVNDELRHALYWINSMRLWNAHNAEQNRLLTEQNLTLDRQSQGKARKPSKRKAPSSLASQNPVTSSEVTDGKAAERLTVIPQDATRMMRGWFQNYVQRFRLPNPKFLPLTFNVNNGALQAPKESTFGYFGGWAKLTTLTMGKRVMIPFQRASHVDDLLNQVWDNEPDDRASKTVLQKTFELHERKGDLYFKLVFKREAPPWHDQDSSRTPVLALDLGLRNFLASSKGDLRGINLLDTLYRFDREIMMVQKGLQNAGVTNYGTCQRYKNLVERTKGYLKTNIRTWLWSILDARLPRKVVIEKLAFTEALDPASGRKGLGPVLNRLVRGFGQRIFREALAQWSTEFGFEVQEVEPAYTSQTCSRCDFVHAENRNGNVFRCRVCGHRGHADVNAAQVQERRSFLERCSPRPGDRHAWWSGTLKSWVVRLAAQLMKAPPGSTGFTSLVGRARTGVGLLLAYDKGPKAPGLALRRFLEALLEASDQHLCTTIRRCGQRWVSFAPPPLGPKTFQVSTR